MAYFFVIPPSLAFLCRINEFQQGFDQFFVIDWFADVVIHAGVEALGPRHHARPP